uniref:1-phosphofructokinase n=1 Tax=Thermodesulfobium narugense TaxID=184064 RepID=A0A7C5PMS6_9BACT
MIYTVTLNPALDRQIWVEDIKYDESNRIIKEATYAGGKGIDVSRVLANFGADNVALGFVGGFSGEELEGRLLNDGVRCNFTYISANTRTNIILNDEKTKSQTLFNAIGPEVQPQDLMRLIKQIQNLPNPEYIIISGSLPVGVQPAFYNKLIDTSKEVGAIVVFDTDGRAMKVGLSSKPHIIKPNIHELERLVDKKLKDINEIAQEARTICNKGINIVLVSMGAKGMLCVSSKEEYWACPPPVEVQNTIGAGDSSVAGFVLALKEGKSLKDALAFAVAAGTATTTRPGTAVCLPEDVELIYKNVTFRDIA